MIWCVEDDENIRELEIYALNSGGFMACGFEDGNSFWNELERERPDLVILDVMLPGIDGVELLTRMKQQESFRDIPVIMATARGAEYDKIQSLELGADDYLVKPFGMLEMVSRVKAVLRRCHLQASSKLLQQEGLVMNLEERTVMVDGERVLLTYKEFELLRIFLTQPGIAHRRSGLFSQVWDVGYMGDSRTLDMHIRTLRQKLGQYGTMIETVRNIGYRWKAPCRNP